MLNVQFMRIIVLTACSLLAFAGNSILCRLALGDEAIDAPSFTIIRLLSGIAVLLLIIGLNRNNAQTTSKGSWSAAVMLFLYALTFSYAYVTLDTGTGALILFGLVQLTMIVMNLLSGQRLHYTEWLGVGTAFAGFVYLVAPTLSTPSFSGFVLMAVAGIAWGLYTLRGRESANPLHDTAYNFLRTLPFIIVLMALTFQEARLTQTGILLAVLSGAVASGLGYTIWYIALGGLSVVQAAVVQLLVPVIATLGGVMFAGELLSVRLVVASVLVLGGILLVILGRYYFINTGQSGY